MINDTELAQIISGAFSWIKVRKWDGSADSLPEHHKMETEFLIQKAQELAREVRAWREHHTPAAGFDGSGIVLSG